LTSADDATPDAPCAAARCWLIVTGVPAAGAHPGEAARSLAAALAARGDKAAIVPVPGGALGAARAAVAGHRLLHRRPRATVITLSDTATAHLVGRLLRGRAARWHAHVGAPIALSDNRWARVLDPRLRALRRADLVTTGPGLGDDLHRRAGIVVGGAPADAAALVRIVTRAVRPRAAGRLTILMLGTVNSPHVEHLAMAMRDRGHRVIVAGDVVGSYPPSVLPASGIDVRPIEYPATFWVRGLVRETRPDIVHAHWVTGYGFLAALMRLRPLVAMAWGSDVYGATPRQRRQCRYVLRRADVAMTDSEDLMARLLALGADPARAHVLNWGVDLAAFSRATDRAAIRRELGLADARVVLSPRALTALYNPRVIVDAFERAATGLPDAQLVLKHIGTTRPDIGRALPPGTRVVGHVPYAQMAEYYRAADVCVSIPNSDSSPRSVWEAMACGCACVVSDLPWVRELIEDGRHALVVPPTAERVADAIRRILIEPGLAERLGSNARALVEERRDQAAEMDRLAGLYGRLATAV
jgi:glycosyltransferase involved in cell wall biosynthesis